MADPKSKPREYRGKGLTVTWRRDVCTHSGNCARTLLAVFDPKQRPWVNMQGAPNEEIIKTVEACPSGALGYRIHDTEEPQQDRSSRNESKQAKPPSDQPPSGQAEPSERGSQQQAQQSTPAVGVPPEGAVEISVMEDGPYVIKGEVVAKDANGEVLQASDKMALCRCGGSRNKPFCDGTHSEIGFLG